MKLTLEQFGGLAAALRIPIGGNRGLPPISIDTAKLPPAVEAELRRLTAAAKAAPPSAPQPSGGDRMSYAITVEDGTSVTKLAASDGAVTATFDALMRRIVQLAAPSGSAPR
ncbi:MAG: protealysin inhibitor emfourin [Bauldia sp.]